MRKKLVIAAVLVIALALIAAGTFAPEAVEGKTTNVITTGSVEISVNEYQRTAAGALEAYPAEPIAVMPTRAVSKVVMLENSGDAAAWVRVRLGVEITGMAAGSAPDLSLVALTGTSGDWTAPDAEGWMYYTKELPAGEETTATLDSVTFSPSMSNAYQNSTVTVSVEAQAVQSRNNPIPDGGTVADVAGWPAIA